MRAQLIPLEGGAPIDIVRDLTLVGRKDDCDLRLDHKSVSKLHCVLVKTDGLLLLRDLGSTNGTRVNGQRVRRAALMPNDQVTIAGFGFRIFLGPDQPSESADDHTQQLEADEVVRLLKKLNPPAEGSDAGPSQPLQPNLLPDFYPDSERKGSQDPN
jgi:pSer/pThr/pTyr-binding forkhead associated (FHA) protein